ncbi:hypothetical protein H6F43_17995 [Leptolyngbya sp. FACHB-36]|uniref:HpsJ-like protein, cyanoexosortase A-associated n=1 Tax=Leptolyngbya sp. FACHB-36 TaxID=2692808 RepID=UPI001680167E|nr:HpsJ family protein [Leptolyngbya sp. FACHB-36]MBD2022073.1 hypothetical protein [Leptolyngbya sp. FACHB-36]
MTEATSDNRSIYRFRWIGYGLLIFALIDSFQVLIPPGFMNPAWELNTIGALVERVAVPLLGLALIFFGEFYDRTMPEKLSLKVLSWACLVLAIVFVLMVPLGVFDTIRLNSQSSQQVGAQMEQFKKLEDQLNQSKPEQIKNLGAQLNTLGVSVDADDPEKLKGAVMARINGAKAKVQADRSNQRLMLFKNSVKWNLGALIAATLFFVLWKTTDWARTS